MKLDNVKVDFQATGWVVENTDSSRFGRLGKRLARAIEPFQKSVAGIVNHAYKEGGNKAVCLVNYYQPKYQNVVLGSDLSLLKRNGFATFNEDHRDTFVGLTLDRVNWLYLIKGREYLCEEGHLLAIGSPVSMPTQERWYTRGPKLEDVIKFEKDNGSILIPSHPLPRLGLGVKALLKLIREPSGTRLGLDEETIRRHAKDFDALESYSLGMDDSQTQRVEDLARELGIPTVSNTDSNLQSSFAAYNLFDQLDFSDPESLRSSMRKGLRDGTYKPQRKGFKTQTKDKVLHILLNILYSRRNF